MPDNDNDATLLHDAAAAIGVIDAKYRAADFNDKILMKHEVDAAFSAYSAARLRLLADGVLSTSGDVAAMANLRMRITQAADTQSLIAGVVQLATFLAKFA